MPIWLYSNFILLSRAFDQMNYRVINGIIYIVDIYRTKASNRTRQSND